LKARGKWDLVKVGLGEMGAGGLEGSELSN